MRKFLFCAALLLCLSASPAAGQEGGAADGAPPPFVRLGDVGVEAARLLRSGENRERAWGAYLAGGHGLKGLTTELVRLLSDPTLADGPEEGIVRQASLDALIRLDADVPAEALRALPQVFMDESLILLAKSPEGNQAALLEMFAGLEEGGGGVRWLAAGNLLARAKARGFAARLLGGLKVEAAVTILDEEVSHGFGAGLGGGGGGCGGYYARPEEFPPVGYYTLAAAPTRGAVVVAPGRRPVFYVRSRKSVCGGHFSLQFEGDAARVEYLAALLDTTEDGLGFDARPSHRVVCKDARECRRGLVGVRARIRQSYAGLVGRLSEKGLLDGAVDAPASPPMTFTLYDERRRRTFPLPDALDGVKILFEKRDAGDAGDVETP